MPKMISKVGHIYDGRNLAAGDPFEADPAFVHTLTVLGRAELAPPAGQQYETRVMAAADPSAATTERTKRKYNTRRKAA